MTRIELGARLRQRCLENQIAASAADSDGKPEQANQYRFAARMFALWAEELLAPPDR